MNTYFVLFAIPSAGVQEWMTTVDEATRAKQSAEMMESWNKWMDDHADVVADKGLPLGKTKRVAAEGVTDIKNDLNWYLVVKAESHEAAANLFVGHPHLQIPTSYIEVMDANRMGM